MATVPVEKWTPERRRQLTRDALVEAAAQVFTKRGFHAASLDEIAETAGFTRGAIYKNFGDKEDLFFAVFDRSIEVNLAAFAERLEGGRAIAELDAHQLADIWQTVRGRDPDGYMLELEFRLYAFRNPEVRERYADHQRAMRALVVRFIEEQTTEAGLTLSVPTETVAAIVESASEGFLAASYLDPELGNLFGTFLELFMPVLMADAPRLPATEKRGPARTRKAAKP
jgi:AcrR family transcriptional regulator